MPILAHHEPRDAVHVCFTDSELRDMDDGHNVVVVYNGDRIVFKTTGGRSVDHEKAAAEPRVTRNTLGRLDAGRKSVWDTVYDEAVIVAQAANAAQRSNRDEKRIGVGRRR